MMAQGHILYLVEYEDSIGGGLQQRMKIIEFYEEYGEEVTKEAFGAPREVISRWRKRLKEKGGSLSALIPTIADLTGSQVKSEKRRWGRKSW